MPAAGKTHGGVSREPTANAKTSLLKPVERHQLASDPNARISIDVVAGVRRRLHRCQEIRYLHSGVQQLNKISGSDAVPLGYVQQFNDSAFHNVRIGFCGISNFTRCILMHFH